MQQKSEKVIFEMNTNLMIFHHRIKSNLKGLLDCKIKKVL